MLNTLRRLSAQYVKDAVYAGNDGIVTTFAVVASAAGASLDPFIVLVLGFANLLADGFSMATGNYLGTKSEIDQYNHERAREEKVFAASDASGRAEVKEILSEKGYGGQDADALTNLIVKNKNFFLDFIIFERFGMTPSSVAEAVKGAVVTFSAFMIAGLIPLVPYIIFQNGVGGNAFLWASIFTAATLFFVGAVRTFFSDKSWWSGGLEMLIAGGIAALIAYGIGAFLRGVFNGAI